MKVWDCIFYHGEWDMLRARAAHLAGHVHAHVIVRGTHTFSGCLTRTDPQTIDRSFGYEVETTGETPWAREKHQRDACVAALRAAGAQPTDMVLLADVDEFPRPELLTEGPPRALELQSVLYYLNGVQDNGKGLCSVLLPFAALAAMGGSMARDERYRMPTVHDAGWHFTYQGGAAAIRAKLRAFSHQELNTPELQICGEIERRMEAGLWLGQAWGEEPVVRYVDLHSFAPKAIIALAHSRPGSVKMASHHV